MNSRTFTIGRYQIRLIKHRNADTIKRAWNRRSGQRAKRSDIFYGFHAPTSTAHELHVCATQTPAQMIDTIAHEAVHIALEILQQRKREIKIDESDEESLAEIVGAIVRKMTR
ncbi:MAG TPA: hypothetical protein VJ521_04285 [Acidobacteriota bacterium]|nr:hypothetical protein [Acidobacteriota bacterium]